MNFFSRAYEESVLSSNVKQNRCSMLENCVYVVDLHARAPGPVIHHSKCVLCHRKNGPGYFSSIDEYPIENLEQCKSRLGYKVRYNIRDYVLVDGDTVVHQRIPIMNSVLDCVHTMYSCEQLVIEQSKWFIRICTGTKCTNKLKRNKSNVLTKLSCRSAGDSSKATTRNCTSGEITCNSCGTKTTKIVSNEYGYVFIDPHIYVLCSMCSSPTLYNDAYIVGAVCYGCEMECRILYERYKKCCRVCGKKIKEDGMCRKHLEQTRN